MVHRSAALIEQLSLSPNDIERIQSMFHHVRIHTSYYSSYPAQPSCLLLSVFSTLTNLTNSFSLYPSPLLALLPQTTGFNHLDLLKIGSDHVFIIHRQLLRQDIHEYLSESEQGFRRVFINVDYLLPQPEIVSLLYPLHYDHKKDSPRYLTFNNTC